MVLVMTGLAFAGLLLARQLEPAPQYRRADDAESSV